MIRTGSRARVLFARAVRAMVISALVAVMMPFGVPAAHAADRTWWVDAVNGTDSNPGTEVMPLKTITWAAAQADSTDIIMVEPGTYATPLETFPIVLNGETLTSVAGAATTIIQGDGTHHLLAISGWTSGDELYGFTFDDGATVTGAAVQVNLDADTGANEPAIRQCVFTDNQGGSGGGGLFIGGIADSAIRIEYTEFTGNSATYGGAIKAESSGAVTIWNNDFISNTAQQGGALALYSYQRLYDVDLNRFDVNVTTAGGAGGAIYWWGHDLTYQHRMAFNQFNGCTSTSGGGAVYLASGSVAMDTNTAVGNSAPFGGFAYLASATVAAENNYFTENGASVYGAVWNLDNTSDLDERNDTLYAQSLGSQATHLSSGGDGTLYIVNCIYWNPAMENSEIERATSVSYTCSQSSVGELGAFLNTVGDGMVYADPAFHGMLGAPYLAQTSPCVDAADPADFPAYDYLETPRPQGPAPDIGCYEYPVTTPPLSVYRFFRPSTGTHFYTADEGEKNNVIATLGRIYTFEGVAYALAPANNDTPLYRFFRPSTGTHFYTADYLEMMNIRNTLGGIYSFEGISYNVSSNSAGDTKSAVYRFFKRSSGTHFYTADPAERDSVITNLSSIYQYEGPAFWVGQ